MRTAAGRTAAEEAPKGRRTLAEALAPLAAIGLLPEIVNANGRRAVAPHAFAAMLASRQAAFAALPNHARGREIADAVLVATTREGREALDSFSRGDGNAVQDPSGTLIWTRHDFDGVELSSILDETPRGLELSLRGGNPSGPPRTTPAAGRLAGATIETIRIGTRGRKDQAVVVAGGEAGLAAMLSDVASLAVLTGGKPANLRVRHATRERFAAVAGCQLFSGKAFEFESHALEGRQQVLFDFLVAAYAPTVDSAQSNPSGCFHDVAVGAGSSGTLHAARLATARAARPRLASLLAAAGAGPDDLAALAG